MLPSEAAEGDDRLSAAAFEAYKLVRARKFPEALAAYHALLSAHPERPDLWVNCGVVLQALYRLEEAIQCFTKALKVRPADSGAYINRGAVLGWLGRYDEALADYNKAVEIAPNDTSALLGRSVILGSLGKFSAAIADSNAVLDRTPGHGGAHYNRGLLYLSMGRYEAGFHDHEWRFGTGTVLGKHRFKQPVWLGQKTDKVILVHCEQGLGDNIQFFRYLPLLRNGGFNLILEAPKSLVRLFSGHGFNVIPRDEVLPFFHLHLPMMSLGAVLGTKIETVPKKVPYLIPEQKDVSAWKFRLRALKGKKVGLAWSSGVRQEQPIAVAMQKRKSIPTALMATLLDVKGVSFVSLQKDEPDDGRLGGLADFMADVADMADTAAIIANLDLVITVDSAVAHVAGALGKPVWVLNRYDICWRWLSGDKPSPWYPTAKVFRQLKPMVWDDVIATARGELIKWAQ